MTFATIQTRRDTAANWTSVNPVLADGELALETDTSKLKAGDGSTAWASLPYVTGNATGVTVAGDIGGTDSVPLVTGIDGHTVASGDAWQNLAGSHDLAPGMAAWLTVLGNRHYGAQTLVCIGTSFTAGDGATSWERSWPIMLQGALNSRFPSNGLSTHGRGALYPVASADGWTVDYVTITGGPPSAAYGHGLNGASWDISANGGCTLTYHLVGTSGFILWTNKPSGGSFTWQVDSGTVNTVSTAADAVTGGQATGFTLDSTPGNAHTLTITFASGSSTWLDGIVEYNGDESKGIQVDNFGATGTLSSDWLGTDYSSIAGVPSTMYLIELMGNDWSGNIPVATSKSNVSTILTNISAAVVAGGFSAPQFVLLAPYNSIPAEPTTSGLPWSDYVEAMYEIAASRTDTTVLDLSARMPVAVSGGGPYAEYATDGIHPSDLGHSIIADIIASFLSPQ